MTIQAQSADGVIHEFPDGTNPAVIDGAMKAYVVSQQPKKSPGVVSEVLGAGGAALSKLGSDIKSGVDATRAEAQRPKTVGNVVGDSVANLGRTAGLVGDVINVPGSMINAAQNALVSRPYGQARAGVVTGLGGQEHTEPTFVDAVHGLQGGQPTWFRPLSHDEATARGEADMNTALTAVAPGKGAPGAVSGAAPKVNALVDNAAAFAKAGVRPTLAAVAPGTAPLAKAAAETPLVGARTRNALAASIQDTADATQNIAGKYGQAAPKGAAGEAVQEGIRTFAQGTDSAIPMDVARQAPSRNVTFGDKADALYTRAERLVGDTNAPIPLTNTTRAIQDVLYHFKTESLANAYANPEVAKLGALLQGEGEQLPWSDAAKLRTTIRTTLKADPALRGTISDAQINHIYGALTQDLQAGAAQLGGSDAGRAYQQANQFYRAGNVRISQALQNFVGKETNPISGEATYDKIIRMASDKGGADTGRLLQLKKSLPADQWGDVSATVVDRLGQPAPGTSDQGGFSVNRFVTNYASLSDQGKALLFGNGPIRQELDNLNKVAGLQKGVERAANSSNTATIGRATAMGAVALQPHLYIPAAQALAGMALTGEAMSNPAVVRWITQATAAARHGPKQLGYVSRQLGKAAKANAALVPLSQQVQRLLVAQPSAISAAATPDRSSGQ